MVEHARRIMITNTLRDRQKIHGHSVLRTKFSEIYPRKFVRLVAKVLCQRGHQWPFQWKTGLALCQCDSGDPTPVLAASQKRSTLKLSSYRGRDSFARSQLSTPEESDEAGVKRRRLEGKQGPIPTMKDWSNCFSRNSTNITPSWQKRDSRFQHSSTTSSNIPRSSSDHSCCMQRH